MSVITLNLEYEPDCVVQQLNEDEHSAFAEVQQLLSQPQYRNFVMTHSKTTDDFAHWRPNLLRIKTRLATTSTDESSGSGSSSGAAAVGTAAEGGDGSGEPPNTDAFFVPRRASGRLRLERRSSSAAATPPLVVGSAPSSPRLGSQPSSPALAPRSAALPRLFAREKSTPSFLSSSGDAVAAGAHSASAAVAASPGSSPRMPHLLTRERSSPVLAKERASVLDQSPLRRSQKRCVEYMGEASRMHAFARDLAKVFAKYSTLRANITTGARVDRADPLSPRNLELLPPVPATTATATTASMNDNSNK